MSPRCRKPKSRPPSEVPIYTMGNFPFWIPGRAECVGITGMKRQGKSALLKAWAAYFMEHLPVELPGWGLVVIDTHDEYTVLGEEREDCQLGPLPQRRTVPEFLEEVDENPRVLMRKDLFLGLVPVDVGMDSSEVARQVREVLPHLRRRGNVIVLFEEVGYFGHHIEEALRTVVACWGKDGVVPMFATQGITECPEPVRKQWSKLVSARQVKKSDLLFIKGQTGGAVAAAILQLEPKTYVLADFMEPAPELLALLLH